MLRPLGALAISVTFVISGSAVTLGAGAATANLGQVYVVRLVASFPVPPSAVAVTRLAFPLPLPGANVSVYDGEHTAREDFLVPGGVNLARFETDHRPTGFYDLQTGYTTGSETIYEDSGMIPCAGPHAVICGQTFDFATVGSRQELQIGAYVSWRPIVDVHFPTSGTVSVTGYAKTSLLFRSSGPATVLLTGLQRRRLAAVIADLKDSPGGMCMEDSTIYVISVKRAGDVIWRATADECPGVLTANWGTHRASLYARNCSLTRVIRSLLPSKATASRRALASCV